MTDLNLPQFEQRLDFSDCAILGPGPKGQSAHVLHGIWRDLAKPIAQDLKGVFMRPFDPNDPYCCRTPNLRYTHHGFKWRGRKFHVMVHHDLTADIHSTTEAGLDAIFLPAALKVNRDIHIEGKPTHKIRSVELSTIFSEGPMKGLHAKCGTDSYPLLGQLRAGMTTDDQKFRSIFKRRLEVEVKNIWKQAERLSRSAFPSLPWWGSFDLTENAHKPWLEQLCLDMGEHLQVLHPDLSQLEISIRGRSFAPDGSLSEPSIVVTEYGHHMPELAAGLAWAKDALISDDCPVPLLRQISQIKGAASRIASVKIKPLVVTPSAHRRMEIFARAAAHH